MIHAHLKQLRLLVVAGARDLYEAATLATPSGNEAVAVLDALELQAVPVHAAADRATARWDSTRSDADFRAAVDAWRRPGAGLSLFGWIFTPGRTRREVVELIDRTIRKHHPGRDA